MVTGEVRAIRPDGLPNPSPRLSIVSGNGQAANAGRWLAQPLVEGMDKLHETFATHSGRVDQGTLDIAAGESTILYILPEPIRTAASARSR